MPLFKPGQHMHDTGMPYMWWNRVYWFQNSIYGVTHFTKKHGQMKSIRMRSGTWCSGEG